ncbi:MAG: heat-inducible transcription repressor HrcA [Clostridia bacterium]|nr:heat-inducible transcription repressor HrcA [Clostridia bacterium]
MSMPLDERKARILSAIVELFVASGEPVGSKALASVFENAFSSATIRNEMAALAEMGLLSQPHTSSGRIPTNRGYRLYVDHLMPHKSLSPEEKKRIDEMVQGISGDTEQMLTKIGSVLAELTHCAAVTTTPDLMNSVIRSVEVIPVSPQALVLVVLLASSTSRSRLVRVEEPVPADVVERFARFCSERVVNRSIEEITPLYLQALAAQMGDLRLLPLFTGVYDLCAELGEGRVLLEGQQHLLGYDEPLTSMRQLFDFLSRRNELLTLLAQPKDVIRVTIGGESDHDELAHSAVIVTRYHAGNLSGSMGLIGPTRLDYADTFAKLLYFSKLAGQLLESNL